MICCCCFFPPPISELSLKSGLPITVAGFIHNINSVSSPSVQRDPHTYTTLMAGQLGSKNSKCKPTRWFLALLTNKQTAVVNQHSVFRFSCWGMELSPPNPGWRRCLECMQNNKSCLDAFWTRSPRGNRALLSLICHADTCPRSTCNHVFFINIFSPNCFCFKAAFERARAEAFIPWRINRQGLYFSHPLRRIIWWAGKQ